jgi:hypothetical protein
MTWKANGGIVAALLGMLFCNTAIAATRSATWISGADRMKPLIIGGTSERAKSEGWDFAAEDKRSATIIAMPGGCCALALC